VMGEIGRVLIPFYIQLSGSMVQPSTRKVSWLEDAVLREAAVLHAPLFSSYRAYSKDSEDMA
jgi:hypothetical protein